MAGVMGGKTDGEADSGTGPGITRELMLPSWTTVGKPVLKADPVGPPIAVRLPVPKAAEDAFPDTVKAVLKVVKTMVVAASVTVTVWFSPMTEMDWDSVTVVSAVIVDKD